MLIYKNAHRFLNLAAFFGKKFKGRFAVFISNNRCTNDRFKKGNRFLFRSRQIAHLHKACNGFRIAFLKLIFTIF